MKILANFICDNWRDVGRTGVTLPFLVLAYRRLEEYCKKNGISICIPETTARILEEICMNDGFLVTFCTTVKKLVFSYRGIFVFRIFPCSRLAIYLGFNELKELFGLGENASAREVMGWTSIPCESIMPRIIDSYKCDYKSDKLSLVQKCPYSLEYVFGPTSDFEDKIIHDSIIGYIKYMKEEGKIK